MTSRDFCYWLQGFFEIRDANDIPPDGALSSGQIRVLRNHLNMVFKHEIDPSHGDAAHQEELAKAHEGKSSSASSPPENPSPPPKKGSLGGDSGYRKPPRAMC